MFRPGSLFRLLFLLVFFAIIFYLVPIFWRRVPFKRSISFFEYPILIIENKLIKPLKIWLLRRSSVSELRKVAEKLARERDFLLEQNIELETTLDHICEFRELIEFRRQYQNDSAILARILLRNLSGISHFMWIDAGENSGVRVGMVATYKNCLLGRISEIFPRFSKVVLITDKSCKITAKCVNSGAKGVYMGCNDTVAASLKFVNHLDKIENNDLIISHGGSLLFPPGLAVGRVVSWELSGVYKNVTVGPIVNIKSLEICTII